MLTEVRADRLVADTAEAPIPNGAVIYSGDRIVYAGPADDSPSDLRADRVIRCPSSTLLPGLIDSHVHITTNTARKASHHEAMGLQAQALAEVPNAVLAGVANLASDVRSGVTTMRLLGDPPGIDFAFRQAIDSGRLDGPSLLTCARPLRPSHGTASFLATAVDGPDAIRVAVRKNYYDGASWIKLFVSNVMNGPRYVDYLQGDLTGAPAYSRAEIAAAIEEAHALGLKVAAHAIGGPAMRWAMELGVDSVEHANLLEDIDIEYFTKYGTTLSDPNLQLFFDAETGFAAKPDFAEEWWKEKVIDATDRTRRFVPELIRAGVNICLAVDSNHSFLWKEIEHFAALGASESEALQAVTRNPAKLLDLEHEIGALRPGMRADVVAVAGDPLTDIKAIREVKLVVIRGREIHKAERPWVDVSAE
jgi:imidazolonepropionase-like amidohydrolase